VGISSVTPRPQGTGSWIYEWSGNGLEVSGNLGAPERLRVCCNPKRRHHIGLFCQMKILGKNYGSSGNSNSAFASIPENRDDINYFFKVGQLATFAG
jgi:hypothetical protein